MSYRATASFPAGIRGTTLHFVEDQVVDDSLGEELEGLGLPVEHIPDPEPEDETPGDSENPVSDGDTTSPETPAKRPRAKKAAPSS